MSDTSAERLNDKWLRLVGIPISVPLATLSQMPFYYPDRWDLWWKFTACAFVFTILIWEVGRLMILGVRRRFPSLEDTLWRIFVTFCGWAVLVAVFHVVLLGVIDWLGFAPFKTLTWVGLRNNTLTSFIFWVVLGGVYEALYFFNNYKLTLQRAESLKKQQVQQRLNALKTRVNPHFLFNSLTTLSALIGEDAPKAEHIVDELSKVYRYLLRAARQPLSTLGEELRFADSYSFLLKNRFEEGAFSLSTTTSPDPASLDQTLPTLTLQNALDYLVRTQNLPLKIEVKLLEKQLQITCDQQPKTLSFEASDHDWRQLEAHGARQEVQSDQLQLYIPFTQNNSIS